MKDLNKASRLMDAIGEIDDSLIWEAEAYRANRRYTAARRWLTVAASFLLTFAVILLATIGGNLIGGSKPSPSPEQNQPGDSASNPSLGSSANQTINAFLAEQSREPRKVLKEDIPFFDGKCYLIWSEVGSDVYYISDPIGSAGAKQLIDEMSRGTYANGESIQYYIWLLRADGTVISPHLVPSVGNIYYGTLFDYSVELIPSYDFADLLSTFIQ